MHTEQSTPVAGSHNRRTLQRSALWRIHFWAALLSTPFALAAALTGILYIFTPQIEAQLHGHLDRVAVGGQRQSLDEAIAVATQAAPAGWALHSVSPAHAADDSVKVAFVPPPGMKAAAGEHHHGGKKAAAPGAVMKADAFLRPNFGFPGRAVVVYVNPYTLDVLGSLKQDERFSNWARQLHSRYLQNDNWRWMVELATCWLLVMLITGVYLWWPRGGQSGLPKQGLQGLKRRSGWRQWHGFTGAVLSLISLVILTTGLTWSKYAGEQVRVLRDAAGQASPRIPASIQSSHSDLPVLTWQAAMEAVHARAPDVGMQLMPPKGPHGVWRANQMERDQPTRRFDLLLHASTGDQLYYSGWAEQTAFGKATAIGIPFHRGDFGWWNQLLLLVFGLGVLFSLLSGWMMYFKRRAQGARGFPPLLPGAWRSLGWGWRIPALALLWLMPVLALSAVVVWLVEAWWA